MTTRYACGPSTHSSSLPSSLCLKPTAWPPLLVDHFHPTVAHKRQVLSLSMKKALELLHRHRRCFVRRDSTADPSACSTLTLSRWSANFAITRVPLEIYVSLQESLSMVSACSYLGTIMCYQFYATRVELTAFVALFLFLCVPSSVSGSLSFCTVVSLATSWRIYKFAGSSLENILNFSLENGQNWIDPSLYTDIWHEVIFDIRNTRRIHADYITRFLW